MANTENYVPCVDLSHRKMRKSFSLTRSVSWDRPLENVDALIRCHFICDLEMLTGGSWQVQIARMAHLMYLGGAHFGMIMNNLSLDTALVTISFIYMFPTST